MTATRTEARNLSEGLAAAVLAGAAWIAAGVAALADGGAAARPARLDAAERSSARRARARSTTTGGSRGALLAWVDSLWSSPCSGSSLDRGRRSRPGFGGRRAEPCRTGVAIGLAAVLVVWLAGLPFGAVASLVAPPLRPLAPGLRRLARATRPRLGRAIVLVAVAVAGGAMCARRAARGALVARRRAGPRRARAHSSSSLQPLVVQPLFNRFEPLRDARSPARSSGSRQRQGVEVDGGGGRREPADDGRERLRRRASARPGASSSRTRCSTAASPRGEVLSVAAHELAHVGREPPLEGPRLVRAPRAAGRVAPRRVTERRGGLATRRSSRSALAGRARSSTSRTLPLQNARLAPLRGRGGLARARGDAATRTA